MTKRNSEHAEQIILRLFDVVEKTNLIIPGKSEAHLSAEVCNLSSEKFSIENQWHKKIVRAGKNTSYTVVSMQSRPVREAYQQLFAFVVYFAQGYTDAYE